MKKWIFSLVMLAACGCAFFNQIDWEAVEKLVAEELDRARAQPELWVETNELPVVVQPVAPPETNADIYANSQFHTTTSEAGKFPIISTLTVTRYGPNKFRMDVDAATRAKWPRDTSINLMCTLQDDNGKWHTAACDWVKPLPNVKKLDSLVVCDRDKRTMECRKNRLVGITLSSKCRHGARLPGFRSSTVWIMCDW